MDYYELEQASVIASSFGAPAGRAPCDDVWLDYDQGRPINSCADCQGRANIRSLSLDFRGTWQTR